MKQFIKKIERLKPLIKVKENELNNQVQILGLLKTERQKSLEELKIYQRSYIEGADQIDLERQQGNIPRVLILEGAVEVAKDRWAKTLTLVKQLESKVNRQTTVVIEAQRELKSFEKLSERYTAKLREAVQKVEQKVHDEQGMQTQSLRDTEENRIDLNRKANE